MGTWVFHPGAVITSWLLWLVGPARVEGLEHVPRTGPMLVVANHCSNLDPPTVGWAVGHRTGRIVHFMAKEEMRSWPVAGLLARDSGVIFVRRGAGDRSAQRLALATLEQGGALGVFPEGTRSRDGRLAEGRAGAALLAMRTGVPIVPVGVAGTQHLFRDRRLVPRRSKVTIRIGPPSAAVQTGSLDRAALRAGTGPSCGRSPPCCPSWQQRSISAPATDRIGTVSTAPFAPRCASPSAPASAMACGWRSTRPSTPASRAKRSPRSASWCTTPASRPTSRTAASAPPTWPTRSRAAPSSSAPTASRPPRWRSCAARPRLRELEVIDATCTWVLQSQKAARELAEAGYTVCIIGHEDHPEVKGVRSYAGDKHVVVDDMDRSTWERVPRTKKLGVLSQSTILPHKLEEFAAFCLRRCHDLRVVNTVCPVTLTRQDDSVKLAAEVDAMVVVGGKNSSNTKELAVKCREICDDTIHVADAESWPPTTPPGWTARRGSGSPAERPRPEVDLEEVRDRIYALAADQTPVTPPPLAEQAPQAPAQHLVGEPPPRDLEVARRDRGPGGPVRRWRARTAATVASVISPSISMNSRPSGAMSATYTE